MRRLLYFFELWQGLHLSVHDKIYCLYHFIFHLKFQLSSHSIRMCWSIHSNNTWGDLQVEINVERVEMRAHYALFFANTYFNLSSQYWRHCCWLNHCLQSCTKESFLQSANDRSGFTSLSTPLHLIDFYHGLKMSLDLQGPFKAWVLHWRYCLMFCTFHTNTSAGIAGTQQSLIVFHTKKMYSKSFWCQFWK